MSIRKVIGLAMISTLLFTIFVILAAAYGLHNTLVALSLTAAILGYCWVAAYLLAE